MENKQLYETPAMELIEFDVEDVITRSTETPMVPINSMDFME